MSESESDASESTATETGGASQGAPNQSVQQTQVNQGNDFLNDAEKQTLQEWLVYVTGLFAAIGLAIGINVNIQDQWGHYLVSASQQGVTVGTGFSSFSGVGALMTIGVVAATVLGIVFAWNIDNQSQTAYKVAAATPIVAIPVLSIVGGILATQPGDGSLEFVNVIVSGLGSGIAGAIGALVVVFFTSEQGPEELGS